MLHSDSNCFAGDDVRDPAEETRVTAESPEFRRRAAGDSNQVNGVKFLFTLAQGNERAHTL